MFYVLFYVRRTFGVLDNSPITNSKLRYWLNLQNSINIKAYAAAEHDCTKIRVSV